MSYFVDSSSAISTALFPVKKEKFSGTVAVFNSTSKSSVLNRLRRRNYRCCFVANQLQFGQYIIALQLEIDFVNTFDALRVALLCSYYKLAIRICLKYWLISE